LTVVLSHSSAQANAQILTIGGKADTIVYLQSLDIQVEVTGNIASTRYTMVFNNPTKQFTYGDLIFQIPDGRTVTHYAMSSIAHGDNGRMLEAVPVEKVRAEQVFKEIQRRNIYYDYGYCSDSLLTRDYLFLSKASRTFSIGYEEELTLENDTLHYRLPIIYPELEKFSIKATIWNSSQTPVVPENENDISFDKVGKNHVAAFVCENYRPDRTLAFALPVPADIPQVMIQPVQEKYYFLASVAPMMEAREKQWDDELAILWDVSLSSLERDLQREMETLDIIFSEKRNANVHLYFLNNKFRKTGEYKVAGGNWDELKSVLETTVFDGGTDFSQINLNDIAGKEILCFSDGISTLSDVDFLSNAAANQFVRPIHSIVSSPKTDYGAMKLIASKTNGKFINLNALFADKLKKELLNETPLFLGTEHEGALSEIYPNIAMPVNGYFSMAGISNTNNTELTLLFGFGDKIEKRIQVKLDAQKAASQSNIYKIWAQKKIAELDLEYEKNRVEIIELGRRFGIVTRNTTLMMLDHFNDYIRLGIEPPDSEPELQAAYWHSHKMTEKQQRDAELNMLKAAMSTTRNLKKWWNTNFTPRELKRPAPAIKRPEPDYRYPMPDNHSTAKKSLWERLTGGGSGGNPKVSATLLPLFGIFGLLNGCTHLPSISTTTTTSTSNVSPSNDCIHFNRDYDMFPKGYDMEKAAIKPVRNDNDYLNELTGEIDEDYQLYLQLRNDYINSPSFYLTMADWFYKRGDREIALRVLTSIVELEPENVSFYRLLGYKLKEYGEYEFQKIICQKIIKWRPMEPQSYRDYALALADNGEPQAALDSLYSILTRPFTKNVVLHTRKIWEVIVTESIIPRSRGIEEVIVTEINRLIAKHPNLNTSKIDKRLLTKVSVDFRAAINWNVDNANVMTFVKDPHGNVCYWGQLRTKIGGRLSYDVISGYGPGQFMLKKTVDGKYQIHVNYQRPREFVTSEPVIVMVEIFTNYAGLNEQRRIVTLHLLEASRNAHEKRVMVTEFEL
jgi:tetratricopeptide (TPR) repeat protein